MGHGSKPNNKSPHGADIPLRGWVLTPSPPQICINNLCGAQRCEGTKQREGLEGDTVGQCCSMQAGQGPNGRRRQTRGYSRKGQRRQWRQRQQAKPPEADGSVECAKTSGARRSIQAKLPRPCSACQQPSNGELLHGQRLSPQAEWQGPGWAGSLRRGLLHRQVRTDPSHLFPGGSPLGHFSAFAQFGTRQAVSLHIRTLLAPSRHCPVCEG